jgi:hypothetical protein
LTASKDVCKIKLFMRVFWKIGTDESIHSETSLTCLMRPKLERHSKRDSLTMPPSGYMLSFTYLVGDEADIVNKCLEFGPSGTF